MTEYTLVIQAGGNTVLTQNLSSTPREYTVNGLTPKTQYTVKISATNAVGTGSYSGTTSVTTNAAAPDTMADPTIQSYTSRSITCAFTAPASNGEAITAYGVQYKIVAADSWTLAASDIASGSTSYTVTGLDPNVAYVIRAQAQNSVGTSTWSAASNSATTNAEAPGAPDRPTVSNIGDSLTASWSSPSEMGGLSTLTGYTLQLDADGGGNFNASTQQLPGSTTTYTWATLVPGTTYQVRVSAINAIGTGPNSVPSNAIVVAGEVIEESIQFVTTLNLAFSEWPDKKAAYQSNIAGRLNVTEDKITLTAREGSTVVTNQVAVTDTAAASSAVQTMQAQASSGTLSFGGASAVSMSASTTLISNGPGIATNKGLVPNLGSANGSTVVTITGDGTTPFSDSTSVMCNGAEVTPTRFFRRSYQSLVISIPSQSGIPQFLVGIKNGKNTQTFYQYDPVSVTVTGCVPSSGNKIGGTAGGGIVAVTITNLTSILALPGLDTSGVVCRFGDDAYTVPADESALLGGLIQCLPPASSYAGNVTLTVSLNGGQQWLDSTAEYTYMCNTEQYIDSGDCKDCTKGATCNGGRDFDPKKNYWRQSDKPRNSDVYRCKFTEEEVCPGGKDAVCKEGYQAVACAVCMDDYHMTDTGCTKCGGGGSLLPLIGLALAFLLFIGFLYAVKKYLAGRKEEEAEQDQALSNGTQDQEAAHLQLRSNPLDSGITDLPQMRSVESPELNPDPQDTHDDTCEVNIELKDVKNLAGGSDYQQYGQSAEDQQKEIVACRENTVIFLEDLTNRHENAAIDVKQLEKEVL